ncbi:MAG: ribosomal protein L7/L12 [bacterium]
MRALLLLVALIAAGAAAYLAVSSGPTEPVVLGAAVAAVVALIMFKLTPSGGRSALADIPRPVRVPSDDMQEELSELSGSLSALAAAGSTRNNEALDGRSRVAVYLSSVGPKQIEVIKVLRAHKKLGLKEAKDLTDRAKAGQKPSIDQAMPSTAARALAKDVERAGGRVEIR